MLAVWMYPVKGAALAAALQQVPRRASSNFEGGWTMGRSWWTISAIFVVATAVGSSSAGANSQPTMISATAIHLTSPIFQSLKPSPSVRGFLPSLDKNSAVRRTGHSVARGTAHLVRVQCDPSSSSPCPQTCVRLLFSTPNQTWTKRLGMRGPTMPPAARTPRVVTTSSDAPARISSYRRRSMSRR
jgi:hypothetical protein